MTMSNTKQLNKMFYNKPNYKTRLHKIDQLSNSVKHMKPLTTTFYINGRGTTYKLLFV